MIVYMYYGLLPEIKLSYLILSYLIIQYDTKSTKNLQKKITMQFHTHKKSNVHQEMKITEHAMRCINALLT